MEKVAEPLAEGVQANTAYSLSGYVNGAYVFIGVTGGTDASTWTPGTGGAYTKLSISFTTGAGQTSATVYVHGWYGQGAYTADDFSLAGPGGTPTTPPPTSTAPPTSRPPSSPPASSPPPSSPPATSPPPGNPGQTACPHPAASTK